VEYLKFMHADNVDRFCDGSSIRLGNVAAYQILEHLTGSDWIGDKGDANQIHRMEDVYIETDQGGVIDIRGNMIHVEAHGFAFSLAVGSYDKLSPIFSRERAGDPGYKSCVRITDIDIFRDALMKGVCVGGKFDGMMLADVGEVSQPTLVRYSDATDIASFDKGAPPADPFLKSFKYAEQSEMRIFCDTKIATSDEYVQICANFPDGLVQIIFKDMNEVRVVNPADTEAAIAELIVIVGEIRAVQSTGGRSFLRHTESWHDHIKRETLHHERVNAFLEQTYRQRIFRLYAVLRHVQRSEKLERHIRWQAPLHVIFWDLLHFVEQLRPSGRFVT
jgi:hypothetical protein